MEELEKDRPEEEEGLDYETLVEKQTDQLEELLDRHDMKELQRRMEELNEFDVAEFLSEIDDNRMPMVFRLLSKETAADVFANFEAPEQERIIHARRHPADKKPHQPVPALSRKLRRQHHDGRIRGP